ncbi:gamma carbonic anhydrase family protein [Burkholderiaceae bacterium DAT-1]|nr:gamma carbonic anhydrase family protein [Burkholderiaceae bacterium DAT-1]
MAIRAFCGVVPELADGAWVDESAQVFGDVKLGENASVWPGAIIRADVNSVRIGKDSNVQDLACLHVTHKRPEDPEGAPLVIGERVTIGHSVVLHGCTIGDECLIGIGTIVLDRAVIEPRVMVGAGSLVPPGKVLKSGHLYLGRPVKEVRALTEDEMSHLAYSAQHYVRLMNKHRNGG